MKILLAAASCFICLFFSACDMGERIQGNGHVITQDRKVSDATKIKVLGSMDIYLQEGPPSVKVEAEENIIPYILTDNNGEWLEIRSKDNVNFNTNLPIKVYITTPSVNAITVAGSGNVVSDSKLKAEDGFAIKIAGSGDVDLQINTPNINASIAGSGDIKIAGETRDLSINIAGAGNYKGENLKAENAKVNIAGSGDATVFADVKLDVKVVGSGDVYYKGNAQVDEKVVGSGTIKRLN